jgi:hypothetical protein
MTDGWADRQVSIQPGGPEDRWASRHAGKRSAIWAGRQMGGQTGREAFSLVGWKTD